MIREFKDQKAMVVLSGGIDSTVMLYVALERHGAHNTTAITFNYGQPHQREITCAQQICDAVGVHWLEWNIQNMLGRGGLMDRKNIPNASYDELEGVSPTYVPYRNGTLLSIATSVFDARLGPDSPEGGGVLYAGPHAEDAAGGAYPDCTIEFIGSQCNAILVGTYRRIHLRPELINMMKWEIVALGHTLRVPFEKTWSCYRGEERHCGRCPTCISRKDAFIKALVGDPTIYD